MKSIRGRITIWLLVGLAVLWAAGGTAIYLTSRSAMLAGIDAGAIGPTEARAFNEKLATFVGEDPKRIALAEELRVQGVAWCPGWQQS